MQMFFCFFFGLSKKHSKVSNAKHRHETIHRIQMPDETSHSLTKNQIGQIAAISRWSLLQNIGNNP